MPGILTSPKTINGPETRRRLAGLAEPAERFFKTVPEAKAYLFAVQSMDEKIDRARLGQTWTRAIPHAKGGLKALEADDRYPAAAWRLEQHPNAIGIANLILAEMPNGHARTSCLMLTQDVFFWVPDAGILDLHTPALGSYPKFAIAPLFPAEPSGHDAIEAEAAFLRLFPEIDTQVTKTWGSYLNLD